MRSSVSKVKRKGKVGGDLEPGRKNDIDSRSTRDGAGDNPRISELTKPAGAHHQSR